MEGWEEGGMEGWEEGDMEGWEEDARRTDPRRTSLVQIFSQLFRHRFGVFRTGFRILPNSVTRSLTLNRKPNLNTF